jgi:chemotaxis protein MotD
VARVSSDIVSALSLQSTRAKSARDETSSSSDPFGSLIDQNTSHMDAATPAARPDIPVPARRDDRAAADRPVADRPKAADRRDDGTSVQPQDRRNDAGRKTSPTAKSTDGDNNSVKSDQVTDAKADSADGPQDAASTDAPTDGAPSATIATTATLEVVPVVIAATNPSGPDATAVSAPAVDANGTPQPLAIAAAAALKAKLDAGTVAAPETGVLPTDAAAGAEATFAAMIAAAAPAATKGAKNIAGNETTKSATTSTGEAKPEGETDASLLTAPTDSKVASKPTAEAKTDQPVTDAPKPDTDATASTDAKPAAEQTRAHRTEQAPHIASIDQSAPSGAPQPQPTHLQATNTIAAAQQLQPQLAANPPVPLSGVAVEIAQSAKAGKTSFDIRLDPAELGRIDVKIEVDKHGNVTSHLTVEKPETLTMLRQDAPQLQRALEQAGLKTNDSGMQFSLRDQSQQQQQQQNGDQSGRHMHRLTINDDDTVTVAPAARGYGRMYGANGGVDISI